MLVEAETTSFLAPIWWNWVLAVFSFYKVQGCNAFGLWGLFWYNDGGEMMETCFGTGLVGGKAEYEESA